MEEHKASEVAVNEEDNKNVVVYEEDDSETGIERITSEMQSTEDDLSILQSSGKKSFNSTEKPPKY